MPARVTFAGSFRQLRGFVLRTLGTEGPRRAEDMPLPEGFTGEKPRTCLSVLEREDFLLCEKDGTYRVR